MLFLTPRVVLAGQDQPAQWSDEFSISKWKAVPSDGVTASIEELHEGDSSFLRLHYSFYRGGGFVVLRQVVSLNLASNFSIAFDVRAEGPTQNLEIKLLDDATAAAGGNVWWINRPAFAFSTDWQTMTQRRKNFNFAWGPDSQKPLAEIQAIEFAIASASGGKGHVDFRRLRYAARSITHPIGPFRTLSKGKPVSLPLSLDPKADLELTFDNMTELGGFTLAAHAEKTPSPITFEAFDDKGATVTRGTAAFEPGYGYVISTPDCECNRINFHVQERSAIIESIQVRPPEWSDTPNHLIESLARELPPGHFPRWASKEQNYWTVCGGLESDSETLISEDGAIELGRAGPTLEPFIQVGSRLLSWADAHISQQLIDGDLPLPQVILHFDSAPWLELTITLIDDNDRFLASYELANTSDSQQSAALLLAIRPLQVLPPSQWLNITGGFTPITDLQLTSGALIANKQLLAAFFPAAASSGTCTGLAADLSLIDLQQTPPLPIQLPSPTSSLHQGILKFPMMLDVKSSRRVIATLGKSAAASDSDFNEAFSRAKARWRTAANRANIQLPRALADIEHTIRAQQAYIRINQDGNGTQPGSRTYERSWIRDGALTSIAMLRLGDADFAIRFLDWYATFQYDSGKIPCVVDKRGSDPVDEHDSTGEYLYAVQTCFEYTRDRAFLDRHWPHVQKGVEYLHGLISRRKTPEYRDADGVKGAMYGLVPESISHEGYSAKPMHSYWDCFFTSRGLHDGVRLAIAHREDTLSTKWALAANEFDNNLAASIAKTQSLHHINYIPGCVELGDFDATSTAIGIWPSEFLLQPQLASSLQSTLDRYIEVFHKRFRGELDWKDYTPYELRLVGVIATQRDPELALHMLRFFVRDQRPQGWRHWAEVVGHNPRESRFIGDMPHTWCGTEFLNSILNMVVLESGEGLQFGAGIPWSIFEPTVSDPRPALSFKDIRTRLGSVSISISHDLAAEISVTVQLPADLDIKSRGNLPTFRLPPPQLWVLVPTSENIPATGVQNAVSLRPGLNRLVFRTPTKR